MTSASKSILLLAYDAECGPCTSLKRLVSFLDPGGKIGYLSLREAQSNGLLDILPPQSRYSSAHLVLPDGGVLSGAHAIPKVLEMLPGGPITSKVAGRWAPGRRFSTFVYNVALRLHDSGACKNLRD